jgi:hypothetical protein
MPPIPVSQLFRTEDLREQLRLKGAHGTSQSYLFAFGLHINPEAVSLETESVVRHLQAFLLSNQRLRKDLHIDPSRDLSPFVDPFPEPYHQLVLQQDYEPDLARFADDYLGYNPTRNRGLDLLPLLAYLDSRRVTDSLRQDVAEIIKPRPTYHFRLPNSHVDDPEWRLGEAWGLWLGVESLANALTQSARQQSFLSQCRMNQSPELQ